MSYLILADGTIQVTTEQEALAIRAHLLAGTPDIAALQGRLRGLSEVLRACQDELGGAAPEAIPGLIRQLRLMEPNDQLRIERNYWRARSMELGEEVILWQKRAGRDVLPTTEVFADLQAKVKAACSNFAQQLAGAKPASETRALVIGAERPPADSPPDDLAPVSAPASGDSSSEPACSVPSPRLELRQIRERLGLSQRELASALGQTQARISLMERGNARVAPDLLAAARALGSAAKPEAEEAAPPATAGPPTPTEAPPQDVKPMAERALTLSDADLDELAGPDASCDDETHDAHIDGEDL